MTRCGIYVTVCVNGIAAHYVPQQLSLWNVALNIVSIAAKIRLTLPVKGDTVIAATQNRYLPMIAFPALKVFSLIASSLSIIPLNSRRDNNIHLTFVTHATICRSQAQLLTVLSRQ